MTCLFEVVPERDKEGVATGNYLYEVYDEKTGGPIEGGACHCPRAAEKMGELTRARIGREMYG